MMILHAPKLVAVFLSALLLVYYHQTHTDTTNHEIALLKGFVNVAREEATLVGSRLDRLNDDVNEIRSRMHDDVRALHDKLNKQQHRRDADEEYEQSLKDEIQSVRDELWVHMAGGILLEYRTNSTDLKELRSRLCSYDGIKQPWVTSYLRDMGDGPNRLHRKQWEFAAITQALDHYGMLAPGRRGIGFAVGMEPLATYFASRGARVTGSDMPLSKGKIQREWAQTAQHSAAVENMWRKDLMPLHDFKRLANFRPVDMNDIPSDLLEGEYDFLWSCGSLEHVGVGQASLKFILNSLAALKPGGVAAHTTEFLLNDKKTFESEGLNFFTEKEIRDWVAVIEGMGHTVLPLDFAAGTRFDVDRAPYRGTNHIQVMDLLAGRKVIHTSISLIIIKGQSQNDGSPQSLPMRV